MVLGYVSAQELRREIQPRQRPLGLTGRDHPVEMSNSRAHINTHVTWIAMMDLACLVLGGFCGMALRLGAEQASGYVITNLHGWLLLFGGILLANYLAGSYRLQYTFSRFNLIVTWLFSIFFALLILSITSYAWFHDEIVLGRGVLLLTLAVYSVLSLTLKLLLYRYLFRSSIFTCRAVILGAGPRSMALRRVIENELVLPAHRVVATIRITDIEAPASDASAVVDGVVVLNCSVANLDALIRSLGVTLIVVGLEDLRRSSPLYPKLKRLRFEGMEVLSPLSVYEIYSGQTPVELVNEEILMQANLESRLPVVRRVKRLTDILVALFGLMVFLPVAILVALAIKLTAPFHPVFYTQTRVGQFGRQFKIIKFRTMQPQAERESGPVWAVANDTRITRLGRFLRRVRLDEIPQFINILRGDMSLVGPRPERPAMIHELEQKIPFFGEREMIPPGLTGWAQIRYPYGSSIEDSRRKLEYDLFYLKHLSLSLDLQIVLSTLRIVLLGKEREV